MVEERKEFLSQIDLFAGAGGLSFGFCASGFHAIYATDIDKDSCASFKLNHHDSIVECADILTLVPSKLLDRLNLKHGQLDVLVGGPPCQGFSTYGKRDPGDPRNKLYKNYLDFLETFYPKVFIIENVVGILSMCDGTIINDILNSTRNLGYEVDLKTLDVSNYGIPQIRKRVFIIGNRLHKTIYFPTPTNESNKGNDLFSTTSPILTVRDAISDLPEFVFTPSEMEEEIEYIHKPTNDFQKYMRGNLKLVSAHSSKRMMMLRRMRLLLMKPGDYGNELRARISGEGLPGNFFEQFFNSSLDDAFEGCRKQDKKKTEELLGLLRNGHHELNEILRFIDSGGFANKYRRLKWDEPSHTLVAHMSRDCSDFVHPEYDRFISVREAARLQSFPDWYKLYGSQFSQLKQIGNAVPPLMSLALAKSIIKMFN
jgi:DNA (cytosine-5)-methyltransferase 1